MKRTKAWWARLTHDERVELVYLERNDRSCRSSYLPDDCSECQACGQPQLGGGGMCTSCHNRKLELIRKANSG